jgi:uncharacterized metal-binding protein YceD (DUF177 family)
MGIAPMAIASEFPRPVTVATLRPGGELLTLAPTEAEAAALARRLGVEGVRDLVAEVSVKARGKGVVAVRGRLRATLDRLCVVSLAPIEEAIDERISVLFRPAVAAGEEAEVALDAESDDEEPYEGGVIDIGEQVAQTLALVLDPWPRAPGASLPPLPEG